MGILFVVSGPSGCGKGTILNEVCSSHGSKIALSVSATTRKPRFNEKHGIDYYFLKRTDFLKHIANGDLLEYNEYCGNFYGTLKQEVEKLLNDYEVVILEIDVNGVKNVRKILNCVSVFIVPPSLEVLKSRLLSRKTESVVTVQKRLNQARLELNRAVDYDYVIVNDFVKNTVDCFNAILVAEKHRSFRVQFKSSDFSNFGST